MTFIASVAIVAIVWLCVFLFSRNILGSKRHIAFIKASYKSNPTRWILTALAGTILNIFLIYISVYTMIGYFFMAAYHCYNVYSNRLFLIKIIDYCCNHDLSFEEAVNNALLTMVSKKNENLLGRPESPTTGVDSVQTVSDK